MIVELHTNHGVISIALDTQNAPVTVENFLNYVRKGHYENTIFHRVIDGFMIQGGGFDPHMNQKPTDAPIDNEATNGLKNLRGTVAMARSQSAHSATSQFFINLANNNFLDFSDSLASAWGYCVFGKVTEGMEVVDLIGKTKTGRNGLQKNVPIEPVLIEGVKIIE